MPYTELALRDNADTIIDVRWLDDDDTPFQIAAAASQVRATESDPTVLATGTIILLGAPDHWVRVIYARADVLAGGFENIDPEDPPMWDVTLTRFVDSLQLVPAFGRVSWNRGVTR